MAGRHTYAPTEPYGTAHQFSEDDDGKPVVTDDGERIGTVTAVADGAATLEADETLSDSIREGFGVERGATSTIRKEQISTVTDEEVRLKRL